MKVLIAPDSFKDSLNARKVCEALKFGIENNPALSLISTLPLADGGEGTLDCLAGNKESRAKVQTINAIGDSIVSEFGVSIDNSTAYIELANTSGIQLLTQVQRNPLYTSTYGTGLVIKSALNAGYRNFIIGLGGSASNDAGAGLMQALGLKLLDENDQELKLGGKYLQQLQKIDDSNLLPELKSAKFIIACDVTNPLTGPLGASKIYGPQKGASTEMIEVLERAIKTYADHVLLITKKDLRQFPGTGAAGGTAFSLLSFLNASIRSGFDVIAEATGLEDKIHNCDIVITGEGKLDRQTFSGKTICKVAQIARKLRKKIFAVAGIIDLSAEELKQLGITAAISLETLAGSKEEAMKNTEYWLSKAGNILIEQDLEN